MIASTRAARRGLVGVLGAAAIVGSTLTGSVATAFADPPPPPPPGCSAADFEQVRSSVAEATSAYFFTHPDVNAFFSTLRGQPKDQVRKVVADYLNGNPQAKSDLAAVRAPLHDFKTRCG